MLPRHMMQLRQLNKRLTTGEVGKKKLGEERKLGWLPHTHAPAHIFSQHLLTLKFNPLSWPDEASDEAVCLNQIHRRQRPRGQSRDLCM